MAVKTKVSFAFNMNHRRLLAADITHHNRLLLQILRFWDNCCEKPDLPKLDETPLNFGYPILDGNRPVR